MIDINRLVHIQKYSQLEIFQTAGFNQLRKGKGLRKHSLRCLSSWRPSGPAAWRRQVQFFGMPPTLI